MALNYLQKTGWFVLLLLLQVLVLSNVQLLGCATPYLYIYLLLKFESDTPRIRLMMWAFALGLAIDIFSDTPGMNAAAAVLLAFSRPLMLRLFVPRDTVDAYVPSMHLLGITPFTKYLVACVLIHHTALISIEYFTFAHLGIMLLRIVASTLLTTACIIAIEATAKK